MAKHGGYQGGMPGSMNNLMKQAQRMQRQMEEQQKALEEKEFTGTAGGGAVTVVMTGKRSVKSVTISPEAVDPDDVEMLQDMIVAAFNQALSQVDEENQAMVSKLTGGSLGGPGGGMPF
ncbi:MAG: YbaB/EbfC family nucleoid-associated protein [Lachnospiraceae bacterium]|jgi:DNA-binding YbaB/EbfC family protein